MNSLLPVGDAPRRVAVIGCGLIGGSVAAAIRQAHLAEVVVGYDAAPAARESIAPALVDVACDSIADACQGADWVVFACPVPAMAGAFAAAGPALSPQCLLTDCGSTKGSVIAAARAGLGAAFARYVPGHPIAGSERSGPGAARADLFAGRIWLLCPVVDAQRAAAATVGRWLKALGARVEEMAPDRHDALFGEFSHWPHAVAFALAAAIAGGPHADEAARFSGAGLRDTTRVAASSPELWADILLDNRDSALASAARFDAHLQGLREALARGDRDALVARLTAAAQWRRRVA